jgi:hypothetical protein
MPDPYTPYGRVIPGTALWLLRDWPARRAGGLWLSTTPLDTPCHTPMLCTKRQHRVQAFIGNTLKKAILGRAYDPVFFSPWGTRVGHPPDLLTGRRTAAQDAQDAQDAQAGCRLEVDGFIILQSGTQCLLCKGEVQNASQTKENI